MLEISARLREGWGFGVGAMAVSVSEAGGVSVLFSSVVVVGVVVVGVVGVSLEEKRRCFDGREERGRGERRREAKKGTCLKRERFMAFRRRWEGVGEGEGAGEGEEGF